MPLELAMLSGMLTDFKMQGMHLQDISGDDIPHSSKLPPCRIVAKTLFAFEPVIAEDAEVQPVYYSVFWFADIAFFNPHRMAGYRAPRGGQYGEIVEVHISVAIKIALVERRERRMQVDESVVGQPQRIAAVGVRDIYLSSQRVATGGIIGNPGTFERPGRRAFRLGRSLGEPLLGSFFVITARMNSHFAAKIFRPSRHNCFDLYVTFLAAALDAFP